MSEISAAKASIGGRGPFDTVEATHILRFSIGRAQQDPEKAQMNWDIKRKTRLY